jgi:hypothetical protein
VSWRAAFLAQARSDNNTRKLLNRSKVEYCHQLHYLQMTAEKMAKGFLTEPTARNPPPFTHTAMVRFLRTLKGRPDVRAQLGFTNHAAAFSAFIDSLLPLAEQIQRLAPNFAGESRPNPEYPWRPASSDAVIPPAEFDFPDLTQSTPRLIQLVELIEKLLLIE